MTKRYYNFLTSVMWNLVLLTIGSFVFAIGVKGFVIPHGFITGGVSGIGLLAYYASASLSPGLWYFLINIPIFIAGWLLVSRRFIFYSIYGMTSLSVMIDIVHLTVPVSDPFLAALAGGTLMGAGTGIALHSLGSGGGTDIIAIILNQKFNTRVGTVYLGFNVLVFASSFGVMDIEPILYSLALTFIVSQVMNTVMSMFNQRKMVILISDDYDTIVKSIQTRLKRGATLLDGSGAYTGKPKKIILTVVNNYQLKRLEEIVFGIDPEAFMVTENTFNVLGRGFSRRKVY
ncbi:MAG: YitT family protein [Desulfobacteraceae bacterium]|nr:YitT family protein [Desulfobacteraceae bacterium]